MALYQPMPLPEPMNASPHHSKVKVGLTLADPVFVAGDYVAGKLELECRADKGLGVGVILVELFAIQELHSRDHSATSTFIHSKRVFQGPGLPPSNAVQAHPQPGFPSLPPSYYQARRGLSTFLFRIPIPETSPSSLVFGSGVARVRYELRASVGVVWKGDRRLVIDTQTLDVVSSFPHEVIGVKEPEAITIGENGKLWMQGNLVGPLIVAGESACIQLQVKNHSNKKNTGLSVSLNRTLVLPGIIPTGKHAMELSDTLTHVPFRGTEYIIPPGAEGVAHLVFDVPRQARSVRGGVLDGDEIDPPRSTESLFEIRSSVEVKMSMGLGNKDLVLTIPVLIVHPRSVPPGIFGPPPPAPVASPYTPHPPSHPNAYAYPVPPLSPPIPHFMVDHQYNQIWLPPPASPMPIHPHMAYPAHPHQYLMSPAPQAALVPPSLYGPQIARPTSAGGNVSIPDPFMLPPSGLPLSAMHNVPAIGLPCQALPLPLQTRVLRWTRRKAKVKERFAPIDSLLAHPSINRTPLQPPTSAENRRLPQPPTASGAIPLDRMENVSLSPPQVYANTMVHSPRPQLTPKHSFYNERPKSERVEVLERMADVTFSGDIPKDEELQPPSKSSPPKVDAIEAPPTPALVAVLPKRYPRSKIDDFLSPQKNESGLRRTWRRGYSPEVGTRKTDVREMMGGTTPIAIPVKTKSDDALNDSAISRTGGTIPTDNDYNGDEDDRADTDMEVEAKTHRDERGRNELRDALDDLGDAFLKADSLSAGSGKSKGDKRSSGRKKERGTKEDRVKAKTEAKGPAARGDHSSQPKFCEETGLCPLGGMTRIPVPSSLRRRWFPKRRASATRRVFLPLHTLKRGTLPRNTVVRGSIATRSYRHLAQTAAGIPFRPTPQSVRTDRRSFTSVEARKPTPVSPSKSGGRDYGFLRLFENEDNITAPVPPPKPEAIKGARSVAQQPKQDPEVSYDVTSVAALWASMTNNGAAGGDPPIIRPKPDTPAKSGLSRTSPMVPPSKPPLLGKVALPGLAKPESPIVPSIHVPTTQSASSSSRPASGRSNTVDGDGLSKQPQAPKKLSSAINLAQLSKGPAPPSRSKSTDAHPSTATQVPFSADLKTKASGNVTPSSNNQRPASSAGNKGSDAAGAFKLSAASGAVAGTSAAGAARKRTQSSRPIIKSTSVPAMISSSHAVPVLSSTASLARPAPSAPRVATDLVNGRRQIDIGRSGAKAVVDRPAPEPAVAAPAQAVPITKSPPPDLAFGQARLRDLIKKYQTQAN
ncbi:hypothetical protein BKA70DRAFT_1309744 [Coprinopsis sp. MPI-PUGE-AT-0042]|nr:hypothetical protein BKA70DRAFT_1309744 [Coprinopsis sp. MPI-PUGE-AT-0042]